jgi:hypothetical protein
MNYLACFHPVGQHGGRPDHFCDDEMFVLKHFGWAVSHHFLVSFSMEFMLSNFQSTRVAGERLVPVEPALTAASL